jgi:hypothetical protein
LVLALLAIVVMAWTASKVVPAMMNRGNAKDRPERRVGMSELRDDIMAVKAIAERNHERIQGLYGRFSALEIREREGDKHMARELGELSAHITDLGKQLARLSGDGGWRSSPLETTD